MSYNTNVQEIRLAMSKKGITNKKLAEELNIARSSICRKLNGTSEFTIGESQALCDFLELDPRYIFFNANIPNTQQKI